MARIAAILIAAAVLACRGEAPATPAATQATPHAHVTFNVNPSLTYAPIMIAKDEGFFADEGIDAELVSLDSNSAVTAAASGQLDVLSAGVRSGVFNMILRGVPMRIVADKGYARVDGCSADAFIAPIEVANRIEAAGGSLRGERVAMIRGGVAEFLTTELLRKNGLATSDLTILNLPQGTAASSRDRIDAIRLTTEPNLSSALSEGWAKSIATVREVAPGHQFAVLVFGKRLLHDDTDLGRRVVRAYLRGVRRYNEGKTTRNVAIVARGTRLPEEIIRRSCWIAISNDGHIAPEAVQPFLDWALEKNYLDGAIAVDRWWDPSFVDAANERLGAQ